MNEETPCTTTPQEEIECENALEGDGAPADEAEQGEEKTAQEAERAVQGDAAAAPEHAIRGRQCISRGVALFLGIFTLLTLVGHALGNGGGQPFWMIDFSITRDMTYYELVATIVRSTCMVAVPVAGVALVLWAVKPACSNIRKSLTVFSVIVLALACFQNTGDYYVLNSTHILHALVTVPPSLVYAIVFTFLAWRIALSDKAKRKAHPAAYACIAACACAVAFVFPLVEIGLFGVVDHSRQSDAVVVFDDQDHSGSKLSKAATARMKKAAGLYGEKLVPKVIVSCRSGSKDAADALAGYAEKLGVPAKRIFVEEKETSLDGAVANSLKAAKAQGCKDLLVVSDFHNLSRIHMLYRARGKNVYTVPTFGGARGAGIALAMLGEVPSWWACWLETTVLG